MFSSLSCTFVPQTIIFFYPQSINKPDIFTNYENANINKKTMVIIKAKVAHLWFCLCVGALYLQTRQQPLRRHLAHDAVCREGKGKRETEVGQSWHINRLACNRARNWKVRTYANKSVDWKCVIILTKEKAVMNRLRERKENETMEKEARHIAFVWCNVTDAKKGEENECQNKTSS